MVFLTWEWLNEQQEYDADHSKKSRQGQFFGQYEAQNRPVIRILVSNLMQSSEIIRLFQNVLKAEHFETIEASLDQATAVQTKLFNCASCFIRCFSWLGNLTEPFTAIRINILPSKDPTSKLIIIRGLVGKDTTIQKCLESLNKEFLSFRKKHPLSSSSFGFIDSGKNSSNPNSPLYGPSDSKGFFRQDPGNDSKEGGACFDSTKRKSSDEEEEAMKSPQEGGSIHHNEKDSSSSIFHGNDIYTDFSIE